MLSFIKRTFWVYMGLVCLYMTFPSNAKANPTRVVSQVVVESDPIIITVIGFEVLVESTDGNPIILAADLYDSTQQLIRSERVPFPTTSLTMDKSGLSSGQYVLQIATTQGVESFQLYLP